MEARASAPRVEDRTRDVVGLHVAPAAGVKHAGKWSSGVDLQRRMLSERIQQTG